MTMKTFLSSLVFCCLFFGAEASARPFVRDCPANAADNFQEVVDFLDNHMDAVRAVYESNNTYHARRGAERRVKRRLGRDRKLGNLWFACSNDSAPLCNGSDGRHAMGAASNKIRICYNNVRSDGFCSLVRLVAHEFGHAVGIKKDRVGKHSKNQSDRVYKWGRAWGNYCRAGGFDHDLL